MAEPLQIDLFWSFRSPWSYLATPRLAEWTQRYELTVRFRPVYPIAIRSPEFFDHVHPLWMPYCMTDVFRHAEFLGLPFKWPVPDPIASRQRPDGRPDFAVPQPHIHRLTRLGVLAEERGRGIEFADSVSRLICGGTQNWHEGEYLSAAAARASLDLAELDAGAEDEAGRLEAAIERNQIDHAAAGHWGVPTCAFRGEPFFGQDRLDVLRWRLERAGLRPRL